MVAALAQQKECELGKGSPHTKPQKGENRERWGENKVSQSVSFFVRQENGKAQRMHLLTDSGERQEGTARQGDQFSPPRACVVSLAKCREIVRVEGWNSCILPSEKGLDERGPCDLRLDRCPKSSGEIT